MKVVEILRAQIKALDMQGCLCEKILIGSGLLQHLTLEMKSIEMKATEDYSDVATRLMGIEIEIDDTIASNEFRLISRKA